MKKHPKISHIEAHDECGNLVFFEMPYTAMIYGSSQDMYNMDGTVMPKTREKLLTLHYKLADHSDVLIHDLDDKIKVVNRLKRKGVYV